MAISTNKLPTTDTVKLTDTKTALDKVASKPTKSRTVKKPTLVATNQVKTVKTEPVKDTVNTAKYINKNLKVSPRKLRLTIASVKNLEPAVALSRLKFTNSNAARLLAKCLEDALASAKYNYKFLSDSIKFHEFRADEGIKIKRMDKSHGSRYARGIIQKRHSRLVITLSGTIAS